MMSELYLVLSEEQKRLAVECTRCTIMVYQRSAKEGSRDNKNTGSGGGGAKEEHKMGSSVLGWHLSQLLPVALGITGEACGAGK